MGAVLAQDFANQYPETVQSLACFSMVNVRQTKPRKYPLLIGCGKHDIPMELSAIRMWKKNEPKCGVIIFEGAGHCVNMDTPNKFNAAMEEFWLNGNCNY